MAAALRALVGEGLSLLVGVGEGFGRCFEGPSVVPGPPLARSGVRMLLSQRVPSLSGVRKLPSEFSGVMATEEGPSVPPNSGSLFVGREMGLER